MLHKETVTPGTLDLIQRLMNDQQLNFFYLVGGTALSLRIGHRLSIDIDLFSSTDFDGDALAIHLKNNYDADVKRHKANYVSGRIGEIDFDFISHKYPSNKPIETIDGIRMMSNADISAMKINAIVNSGQRIKDFIDMHYLLKELPLENMLKYYCEKYPNVNADTAISSLLYHNDIDFSVQVMLMDSKLKWKDIETSIKNAIADYKQELAKPRTYLKQEETNYLGVKKNKNKGKDRDQGLSM